MKIAKRILIAIFLFGAIALVINLPKSVPNVEFTTLNGKKMSFETLRGKPVVVTFWATDCESCLKEIPLWLDLYSRYHSQGLEIIGVAMYFDPPNHVVEFTKQHTLPYSITLDIDAKIAKAFDDVNVTPTTFLISPEGKIVWHKIGLFELTELQLQIENFLKEK